MHLKLVSFELCPYVQRSVITLNQKKANFEIEFIDLANKPEWFLKLSPLGKVPILIVDGKTVLFESAVINEFIDETYPPRMLPEEPILRAKERAWIEFGSAILVDLYQASLAKYREDYQKFEAAFLEKIKRLESEKISGKYFRGEVFSLMDSTYAPIFSRAFIFPDLKQKLAQFPKVFQWTKNLESLESVQKSLPERFQEKYREYCLKKGSWVAGI